MIISEQEKNRIRGLHKNYSIISEQKEDFLDKNYIPKLIDNGYVVVDNIGLPDGEYQKGSGGYQIEIKNNDGGSTGYMVVTHDGIRGMWSGPIEVKGKTINAKIYKIFYNKDLAEKPKEKKKSIAVELLDGSKGEISINELHKLATENGYKK
tara:strand:+ start:256 stop:711 length:456 start_codon:yes stop_codon:yes gene_type:complete